MNDNFLNMGCYYHYWTDFV